MAHLLISFQVRIKDSASLEQLGLRISKALDCYNFVPSNSKIFEGTEGLETNVLGLWVTLSYWPRTREGENRSYRLTGGVSKDIRHPWKEVIDVSDFILKVLTERDSHQWYIPSPEELKAEAEVD